VWQALYIVVWVCCSLVLVLAEARTVRHWRVHLLACSYLDPM